MTVDRDGRITLAYTPNNQVPMRKLYDKLRSMLGEIGLQSQHLVAAQSLHAQRYPAGRLRASGRHLPVRRRSRLFRARPQLQGAQLDNLYVVDTSFFVSIGAVNPSLTAIANALRGRRPPAAAARLEPRARHVAGRPQGSRFACSISAASCKGLALVTFPAASAIFASPTGFHLSGAQYGAMFIPQVALAILASAAGPWLAQRLGIRGVLLLGLGADLLSMALLAASALLMGAPAAFALLCLATGALGLGFGATVMTLNTWVERLAADRADAAVLTLNALLGVGTALAPLLVALFSGLGVWWALPLVVAIFAAGLFLSFAASKSALGPASAAIAAAALPQRFWFYAAAALLYGVVETLSGNWATLYLSTQRSVPAASASYALTAFWLMVTLGRVALAASGRRLPAKWVYVALPLALAVVFQFVAHVDGATTGIIAFGAAGLACSGILPLSISLGGSEFPTRAATISGELIAFYQIGYGVAAFGVGPLKEFCDVDYSTAFSLGSLVSLLLGGVALAIARRSNPRPG